MGLITRTPFYKGVLFSNSVQLNSAMNDSTSSPCLAVWMQNEDGWCRGLAGSEGTGNNGRWLRPSIRRDGDERVRGLAEFWFRFGKVELGGEGGFRTWGFESSGDDQSGAVATATATADALAQPWPVCLCLCLYHIAPQARRPSLPGFLLYQRAAMTQFTICSTCCTVFDPPVI